MGGRADSNGANVEVVLVRVCVWGGVCAPVSIDPSCVIIDHVSLLGCLIMEIGLDSRHNPKRTCC